jgi:hypothetical protein
VQAALRGAATAPRRRRRIGQLQAAALAAAEADATLLPQGLAVLFDLALHAADDTTATAVLAELLHHGQARCAATPTACAPGSTAAPSATTRTASARCCWPRLAAPVAAAGHLGRACHLAALHGALQRPAPRRRLEQLATQSAGRRRHARGRPHRAAAARGAACAVGAGPAAWALVDRGGDAVPALQPMLEPGTLAPPAIAASGAPAHAGTRRAATRGPGAGAGTGTPPTPRPRCARRWARCCRRRCRPLGADWRRRRPYWQALAADTRRWQRLARYQLATLYTDGLLEPRPPLRCQDLPQAQALWQQLAAVPRYARAATGALRHPLQTVLRPALRPRRRRRLPVVRHPRRAGGDGGLLVHRHAPHLRRGGGAARPAARAST